MKFIKKLFKILIAILLLPFCIGSLLALWQVILIGGPATTIWIATLFGAILWILIYLLLPEPTWIYVLGHELTHAIGTWIFGGKLKKIKVTSGGGHVLTTKSNFITSLAPYFFPFYVVLVIIIFSIGNFFFNWSSYILWFYFFIGMMYAFHITLTKDTLKIEQPDIKGEGYVFGTVIILLGNILVLLIGIPLLTNTSVSYSLNLWLNYSIQIYHFLGL